VKIHDTTTGRLRRADKRSQKRNRSRNISKKYLRWWTLINLGGALSYEEMVELDRKTQEITAKAARLAAAKAEQDLRRIHEAYSHAVEAQVRAMMAPVGMALDAQGARLTRLQSQTDAAGQLPADAGQLPADAGQLTADAGQMQLTQEVASEAFSDHMMDEVDGVARQLFDPSDDEVFGGGGGSPGFGGYEIPSGSPPANPYTDDALSDLSAALFNSSDESS